MSKGKRPTPEFRREAVRLALTSGRTRREIAEALDIGLSTLSRWLRQERDAEEPIEAHPDLHAELKRLRRENAVLKQERDILKNRRRAVARLCAVETPATLACGGELPMAYWRHSTPLKDVAHGPMRT